MITDLRSSHARRRRGYHAAPPRFRPGMLFLVAGVLAVGAGAARSPAESLLEQGQPAPEFSLSSLDGKTVRLTEQQGHLVLLLFGELYNRNSIDAGKDIQTVLNKPELADAGASAFMIITQQASPADLRRQVQDKELTLPVLHDPSRTVFSAYHVMVLPSLVILDGKGVVILPCAGYPLDFEDLVTDTIMFAAGQLSEEEYSQRRTAGDSEAPPESQVRAMRLAALGEQLIKRGSVELALANFAEALELHPDCIPARLGLGTSLLQRGQLAQAEEHFLRVLEISPDSADAALGLIQIHALRGGDELHSADERLRELLRKRPNDPRVLYLAGLVAEKSGDMDAALGHYKRAAEQVIQGREGK